MAKMKIKQIEIHHFRGIVDIKLPINSDNLVIWGPNGSGKSAVVDAIDFLLRGEIPRLLGDGTQGISITKHGPHVDYTKNPNTATVTAVIEIPNIDNDIVLKRTIAEPDKLELQGATKAELNEIFNLATHGQHSLSRKEILKYIAAQPAKRSAEVQAVLNLDKLEETRKSFVRVKGKAEERYKSAEKNMMQNKMQIASIIGIEKFDEERLLQGINQLRRLLNGREIDKIGIDNIQKNISPPAKKEGQVDINPDLVENTVNSITKMPEEKIQQLLGVEKNLRLNIGKVLSDESMLRSYSRMALIEMGFKMLDGSGVCPLCEYKWPPEELETILKRGLAVAKETAPIIQQITSDSEIIRENIVRFRVSIINIAKYASTLLMEKANENLQIVLNKLQEYEKCLENPIRDLSKSDLTTDAFIKMFKDQTFSENCQSVLSNAKAAVPHVSPEQTAWDTLTALKTTLPYHYELKSEYNSAALFKERADVLLSAFEKVKEEQLESLYDSIKNRFVEFYKFLHKDDEKDFDATLKIKGQLFVDFYGRGMHPPLALHSEGHQDSMGLCLYLALAEKLTEGKCMLTVLDDVVMSVDSGHRRKICRLLKTYFPDRQFLITTHDKNWAEELKSEKVVKASNSLEFCRWNIDTGPIISDTTELWELIDFNLKKNDVSTAAFFLRNGCERFFESACDSLGATIRYKSDNRWELGDFLSAALSAFKKYIKLAKTTAESWNNEEHFRAFKELDNLRADIFIRTQCEQWMVNASVHYNKLIQLSVEDFRPIVDAFKDCFSLFRCSRCGGIIYLVEDNRKNPINIRCACQNVNWNLQKKSPDM